MAADPYGFDDQDTIDQSRRKAQIDALGDPQNGPLPVSGDQIFDVTPATENKTATTTATTTTNPTAPAATGGGTSAPAFQAPQIPSLSIPNAGAASAPPITNEVTALLRQRLQDLSNPLDVTNDPIFLNQQKAFNVQAERDKDRERAALAQRMYARGTSTGGGLDTGVRGLEEQQGERNQAYTAQLAGQRLQQREQQLNQAISMARAVGQDDVAMQLENEKLKLAAEALQLQQQLGLGDLNLRGFLGAGQLGLGYDQLGFNYANLITGANATAANSVK